MVFLPELPTRARLEGYAVRFPEMDPGTVGATLARLRWASLLIRSLEAYFARHRLSQTQFPILIDREPDRDSPLPSEIADRLDISRPIVSTAIKRLVGAGVRSRRSGLPAAHWGARPAAPRSTVHFAALRQFRAVVRVAADRNR